VTHRTPDGLFLAFQSALAGRYALERELGRGGMGIVYLARELHLDRLVAIKLLPPELAERPALRERFLREARLAARLSHPHIIPIHAVHEVDGFVCFVMAFIDGETLTQRVHARGPLSVSDGIRLLREVAWALGHAHGQALVHRDIKPDNILIEHDTGRALVADFGIAAATDDDVGTGAVGTPEFMSPEQAKGAQADARSDIYSLGVTAYFALSGHLPFSADSSAALLAMHLEEAPRPLSSVANAVPRRLATLVDQCLAKDPERRPVSAQHFADALALGLEQKRALPAALRAFVKRGGRLDGAGTVLALFGGVAAGATLTYASGPAAGLAAMLGVYVAIPAPYAVIAARRLLDLGFAHADLESAFMAERDSSREERSGGVSRLRRWLERGLASVAQVTGATTAVLLPFLFTGDAARLGTVGALALLTGAVATLCTLGYLGVMQLRRDVDLEFWQRVWTGAFGQWAFAVARRIRGRASVTRAMTHRATELSLSLAAEQLYETLPQSTRESLGDLPTLMQRLQRDATNLRRQLGLLQDAPFAEQQSKVQARLQDVVNAMESIRLGLLRLHAGALSLQAFTTQLELAEGVCADVDRLIEAHEDVHAALRFPPAVELTPA
jgi:serine/threonine-protein kinase